jgi:hypothetical protein
MRGKKALPRTESTKSSSEDAEWGALGIHVAFLRSSQIYKAGVRKLWRIEKMNLRPNDLRKAKFELDKEMTNRIEAEVGPLMPSRTPDIVGNESFYGVLSESLKIAGDDPEKVRRAYSLGLVEFDAEHRFYAPFQTILNDHFAGTSRESTDRYLKLLANNQLLRYGEGLPPMRGNLDHRIILKTGLGLGLENLSATNLARFYDTFCPCAVEVHDADDLRKLRNRILEEGRKAREAVTPKFSGTNQQVG